LNTYPLQNTPPQNQEAKLSTAQNRNEVLVAFKKFQFERKTSGLTFYAAMRLRLLLDDPETIESILEPSVDSAEGNGDLATSAGSCEPHLNCASASQQRQYEICRPEFKANSR
jgi:hypothetical protein